MPGKNARKPTYGELADLVLELREEVRELKARVKDLESELAKSRKNSSNSHKPPSSDIVKPPRKPPDDGEPGRKIGGQPGHQKYERKPFAPKEIDETHIHTLEVCPDCRGPLRPSREAPRVVQQIEVVERPVRIDEHRGKAYWCGRCQKIHYAPLPAHVEKGGLAGPRLTALVAYLKGGCHTSYSTVQALLGDAFDIPLSRGQLAKLVRKSSDALETPCEELLLRLPGEPALNVDETGHKTGRDRFWTWVFRTERYAVFKIDESRGSKVLIDVLGEEFNGVLGCDYFSAYRKYMGDFDVAVQFCLAHLIRDLKFLSALRHKATARYGERVLGRLRDMFRVIHRGQEMSPRAFSRKLKLHRDRVLVTATANVPDTREAQNLYARFRDYGDAYFRFVTTPGISPTNNLAEQAIRFVVIDRRITQGTRTANGRRWSERIWTVMATCSLQKRSPFHFLNRAVSASFAGKKIPSLLLAGP